jgi:hypothetical protein
MSDIKIIKNKDNTIELKNNGTELENILLIDKTNKTPIYYLNAIKKCQAKNSCKIKEYQAKYRSEKAKHKIEILPNEQLTKSQLLIKIQILEDKLKKIEN